VWEDTVKRLALILVMVLAFYVPFGSTLSVWADSKSDCKDQYESEVESCKSTYNDPEDSDDLRMCIDDAKDEYDSCMGGSDNGNEAI
jgi:hypothetical protein